MRKKKKIISYITLATMICSIFLGSSPIRLLAEDTNLSDEDNRNAYNSMEITQTSGPSIILHYDMKETQTSGADIIIRDISGNDITFDGTFKNTQNGSLLKDDSVGYVSFNGGAANSNSGYVEIPKGSDGSDVLENVNGGVTVSTLVNWEDDGVNRWIFGLGRVSDDIEYGNGYFFVTPRHGKDNKNLISSGISQGGWRNEALIQGTSTLTVNKWKLVTSVLDEENDIINLYVDGMKVASGFIGGRKLADIIDYGANFSGFLGKSIFGNDPYCKEKIADFRIYNAPLADEEVLALYTEAQSKILALNELVLNDAKDAMNIILANEEEKIDAVTKNIILSTKGNNGVIVTWSSSNEAVISNTGVVTRPATNALDEIVTLTATFTYEGLTTTKEFIVTVLKEYSEQAITDLDASKLAIHNQDNIKGNIRLATKGENGSTITWVSSSPEIIKGSVEAESDPLDLGKVIRPGNDTNVTLTATVTLGTAITTRTFELTVKKDPGKLNYNAYFFSYFTGEYEGGEEISFAIAEEPLKWRALNNGQSVIQSSMGEKGLRDPFIIRSPEGDKFYLLATDLKMGESTNFDQAQITGSHYMMIWESDDLVNWSEQRMVEVAPKKGGNTWAPEAFYDEESGDYVVFWASSMKVADTYGKYPSGRPSGQYNVMYYATTRDFYTFSEPKVYIDDGYPTIDTTMIKHNDTIYRFTKSEVGYKVYYEKANSIFYDKDGIEENGYQFDLIPGTKDPSSSIRGAIGHAGNNEGQTVFKDIHEDKWYLFLDSWPYHVRVSTDLEDGTQFKDNLLKDSDYALPPGPRHGTVIPITQQEYDALESKYGVKGPEPSIDPVVHYTFDEDDIEGTLVKDVSGNGYNATLVGGATLTTQNTIEALGGAVALDGSTGYIEMPKNLVQNLNLEKMTISTWVKVNKDVANQRIFDFASETGRVANRNTMYLSTNGDTGELEFATITPFSEKFGSTSTKLGANYKYAIRTSKINTNTWHHVAISIDNFDAVLYVDGAEVARSTTYNIEPRMLLETTMNYIGKSRNSSHKLFDGQFDDFRIYNRALAVEEVAVLATQEMPEPEDPPVEEPSDAKLILDYDMSNVEGTIVQDNTGKFNGTWVNKDKASYIGNSEAGAISFAGGRNDSYIEIPKGVLDGLTEVTVSSLVNWKGQNEAEWIFALGTNNNNATSKKYMFITPKKNSGNKNARAGFGITGWSGEAGVDATTGTLQANEWKLVTAVISETDQKITLYIDGIEVGSASTNGYTLAQINNTTGFSGYVAKSFYSEDPYFGGMIADFEIYDEVLTQSEIKALKQVADEKVKKLNDVLLDFAAGQLDYSDFLNKNVSKDEVMTNLVLPGQGEYGTTIIWESSNPAVIANDGTVNRPKFIEGDQSVILKATISDGMNFATREFTVKVIKMFQDSEKVALDAQALKVYNISDVRGNVTLPTKGETGSIITWVSSDETIITPTGEVTRPDNGRGDVTVKLTATVMSNDASVTKEFTAIVREKPLQEELEGYVFTYFIGEGYSNGEQIYFALSEGNDPLHWNEMNGGKPVFVSELGEKGLRDPFIIRSPEGDRFYLIATDLKIHGNGNWTAAQRTGSLCIVVWESTDLVNWSKQRMVQVSPEVAGNTWAPEVFYDKATGEYIVFWASKIYSDSNKTGSPHQRMMYAKTRDFYTFTEAKEYYNPGYSVIDTTMIEHEGKIYRFTKDERGYNATTSPNGKFIFQEVGNSVLGEFTMIKEGIGKGSISQGEGPTIFKSNREDKWYLFIDEFGGRGYVPFETTDLSSGEWKISENYELPSRPRHGTVLPITASEYERLSNSLPVEVEKPDTVSVASVILDENALTLYVGDNKQLKATIAPENATSTNVIWKSDNEAVATVNDTGYVTAVGKGTTTISVITVDGGYVATCVITVKAEESEEPEIPTINEIKEVKVETVAGTAPKLPTQVEVVYSDGSTNKVTVVWNAIEESKYSSTGTFIVEGTVVGTDRKAKAVVTVTKKTSSDSGSSSGSSSSGGSSKANTDDNANSEILTQVKPVRVSISLSKGTASNSSGDLQLYVKPYIQDGRTMVGVRDIATLINVESKNIVWDATNKKVFIKADGKEVEFTIGQKYVLVNGEKVEIDVAPQIKDGRTVLPIAHVARILGIEVQFNPLTKEVILSVGK